MHSKTLVFLFFFNLTLGMCTALFSGIKERKAKTYLNCSNTALLVDEADRQNLVVQYMYILSQFYLLFP